MNSSVVNMIMDVDIDGGSGWNSRDVQSELNHFSGGAEIHCDMLLQRPVHPIRFKSTRRRYNK